MKFRVKTPILHSGKRYEIGETLDIPEKAASSLLAIGALAPNPTPPVSGPGLSTDKSGPPEGSDSDITEEGEKGKKKDEGDKA